MHEFRDFRGLGCQGLGFGVEGDEGFRALDCHCFLVLLALQRQGLKELETCGL